MVSAANGKISEVELNGTVYKISFAEEHQFTAGDLIRCQKYTGTDIRSYWITVGAVGSDLLYVNESEFGGVAPLVGDELVQFGHISDTDRQGFVYISAIDDGAPKVDIYDGVDSKSLTGKLRGRYGDLSGISDPIFPDINGYGIYSDNAYFVNGNFNGIISTTMKDAPPQLSQNKI